MSWFNTDVDLEDQDGVTKVLKSDYVFDIGKNDTTTKITFLDPDLDVKPLHYHRVWIKDENGKNRLKLVGCGRSNPDIKQCHFCDYVESLEEGDRDKQGMKLRKGKLFTVIDHSERLDRDGRAYPPQKTLRICSTSKDFSKIAQLDQTIADAEKGEVGYEQDSFQYATVSVCRSADPLSPRIGEIGSITRFLDPAEYENIEPLTAEELKSYFVLDPVEIATIAEQFPIESADSVTVN